MTSNQLRSAAAVLLMSLLVASGCGSSSSDDEAAGGSSASEAQEQDAARVRLTDCLREQGIEVPEPGQGGGVRIRGFDRDKLQEAMEGPCAKYREQAFGEVSEEDRQEMQDAMVKFTSCMRDHGVDIPDFQPGGGGGGPPANIDPDDPRVQEASEACQDELPKGRGGRLLLGPRPGGGE